MRKRLVTDLTQQVIAAWNEALCLSDVGPQDNFFSRGGTSLAAARIAGLMKTRAGRSVRVRTVFQHPTPARFAAALDDKSSSVSTLSATDPHLPVLTGTDPVPLSEQQKAIWFQERLNPAVRAYNCVSAIKIPAALDERRLRNALDTVVCRHDALRTTFPNVHGRPVQVVQDGVPEAAHLSIVQDPGDSLHDSLMALGQTPFDTSQLPLISWVLFQNVPGGGDVLAQVEHHFVHDGWSTWLILEEIAAQYRGDTLSPRDSSADYSTFAAWQTTWMQSPEAKTQRDHWVNLLRCGVQEIRFPKDDQRPKLFSHRGSSLIAPLGDQAQEALEKLSVAIGATPFSVLYAVFGLQISAITDAERFVLAASYRNRRPEFGNTVGMFVNVVGIPFPRLGGRSFREIVQDVSSRLMSADENQEIPFSAVVRELRPRPQTSRNPIFQVCLSMSDWPTQWLDFGDSVFTEDVDYPATGAKFDLDVVVIPPQQNTGWRLLWRYYTEILNEDDIRDMAATFDTLLIGYAADPDALVNSTHT